MSNVQLAYTEMCDDEDYIIIHHELTIADGGVFVCDIDKFEAQLCAEDWREFAIDEVNRKAAEKFGDRLKILHHGDYFNIIRIDERWKNSGEVIKIYHNEKLGI